MRRFCHWCGYEIPSKDRHCRECRSALELPAGAAARRLRDILESRREYHRLAEHEGELRRALLDDDGRWSDYARLADDDAIKLDPSADTSDLSL